MITVFTPTYNRSYTLKRLYDSLLNQDSFDFEWIIVDDGSTDDTETLVNTFVSNKFPLYYFKKENGGKHRAINYGVKKAKGELFFIVDSDDYLPKDSISTIIRWVGTIPDRSSFAGVAGLKQSITSGKDIGSTFKGKFLDATSLERGKNNIYGDKAEVFFTNVIKRYPFPEFEGEKFITEAVVWNRIAHDNLKIRWFNEPIYLFDYLEDGLTTNIKAYKAKNPQGYLLYFKEARFYMKGLKNKYSNCCSYILIANGVGQYRKVVCKTLKITTVEYVLCNVIIKLLRK